MISKVLPLLNRLIPSGLARKGLAKNIPQLENFFESALSAGYGLDTALDFLRNQHEDNDEGLRADEQAAQARVRQGNETGESIDALGRFAGAGVAGAAVPSVIGNLFQDQGLEQPNRQSPPPIPPPEVPEEIQQDRKRIAAMEEFNKRRGRQPSELSRESLTQQFEQSQNPIAQIAPDVAQEIETELTNGLTLNDAYQTVIGQPGKFSKQISALEKAFKMPLAQILAQFYGNRGVGGRQPQQQGQGKQALAQTMQQITQALKNMRGQGG